MVIGEDDVLEKRRIRDGRCLEKASTLKKSISSKSIEMQTALDDFFASCSTKLYHSGIHTLPQRSRKIIDADENIFDMPHTFNVFFLFCKVFDRTLLVLIYMCIGNMYR